MATLTLDMVWINLVATGEAVAAWSGTERPDSDQVEGETRTFGGGRRRSIAVAGDIKEQQFTMRKLSTEDLDTLRSWKGKLVQYRDNKGRRWLGTFRSVPATEWRGLPYWDSAMVLEVTSAAEGVPA